MKINFRGKYENLECDICKKQEESQKHILECSEIMKEDGFKKVEYEQIFEEDAKLQLEVVQTFIMNMKTKEKMLKESK